MFSKYITKVCKGLYYITCLYIRIFMRKVKYNIGIKDYRTLDVWPPRFGAVPLIVTTLEFDKHGFP